MATRNLTKKFLEVRNAAKANRHLGVKDDHHDESGLLKVSILSLRLSLNIYYLPVIIILF